MFARLRFYHWLTRHCHYALQHGSCVGGQLSTSTEKYFEQSLEFTKRWV